MDALVLADDTTGALEAGARFAAHGVQSLVTLTPDLRLPSATLVVDTETRHLSGAEARQRLQTVARQARRLGVRHLYKKTDSTLRGNIAVEFQVLLEAFPERSLVYVPAYPELGRVVKNGHLYVHGVPLEKTAFAKDPLNPSRTGSIPDLLARDSDVPVRLARSPEELPMLLASQGAGTITVCDGSTNEHLETIAAILASHGSPCLAAGPSGFVAYWIRGLSLPPSLPPAPAVVRRGLVVSGSLHPNSILQTRAAEESGVPTFRLTSRPSEDSHIINSLSESIRAHRWACLATSPQGPGSPSAIATRLGSMARGVLDRELVDALVVFGGDTAFALLQAMSATTVRPRGDVLPGIPRSLVSHGGRDVTLVTKAGGFGDANVVSTIRCCLE